MPRLRCGPGDVVVDRLRERVRLLEDHADAAAYLDAVGARAVQVVAVVEQLAVELEARDRVVHAVEAAQEGALAAAGRTDEGGRLVGLDVERDVLDRALLAVVDGHRARGGRPSPARRRAGGGWRSRDRAAGRRRWRHRGAAGRGPVSSGVSSDDEAHTSPLPFASAQPHPCADVYQQNQDHQQESHAPGLVDRGRLPDSNRFRISTGTVATGWQRVQLVRLPERPGGQQHRRRLAGGTCDGEDRGGDDAVGCGRAGSRRGSCASRATPSASAASRSVPGTRTQRLDARPRDQRNLDDREGDRGGDRRLADSARRSVRR